MTPPDTSEEDFDSDAAKAEWTSEGNVCFPREEWDDDASIQRPVNDGVVSEITPESYASATGPTYVHMRSLFARRYSSALRAAAAILRGTERDALGVVFDALGRFCARSATYRSEAHAERAFLRTVRNCSLERRREENGFFLSGRMVSLDAVPANDNAIADGAGSAASAVAAASSDDDGAMPALGADPETLMLWREQQAEAAQRSASVRVALDHCRRADLEMVAELGERRRGRAKSPGQRVALHRARGRLIATLASMGITRSGGAGRSNE